MTLSIHVQPIVVLNPNHVIIKTCRTIERNNPENPIIINMCTDVVRNTYVLTATVRLVYICTLCRIYQDDGWTGKQIASPVGTTAAVLV